MDFYIWNGYRCVYDSVAGSVEETGANGDAPALLLIHPIGVGLSRQFWQPFIDRWTRLGGDARIYNLDLLGCGDSEMPQRAYRPKDWAEQVAYFIEHIAKEPVVLVVQGALLPVAVELMRLLETSSSNLQAQSQAQLHIKGLVLSGPPAWPLMSTETADWKQRLAWSLFSSPLGNAFYRYARRESFLQSFSRRQLFENASDVTANWLSMLHEGSRDMNSRYAVFSFLAGFWRQDYSGAIARIQQPVIIVMGETASTIDRKVSKQVDGPADKPTDSDATRKRLQDYLDRFPRAKGVSISGRNVMPYESTTEFADVVASFIQEI